MRCCIGTTLLQNSLVLDPYLQNNSSASDHIFVIDATDVRLGIPENAGTQ